jgi:pilus assembly protein CpaC
VGWWRGMRIAGLVGSALIVAGAPLGGALQQQATTAEGRTLHVFVNKSVVINSQTHVVRMMTGNPAVIDTVATTPTQIVVTGKTPGVSSFIIWDSPDHSQILDVVVEPDISALRAVIERAYPSQQINVETDGARIILSGAVSSQRIADDLTKMAGLYSTQVINSLTVQTQGELQVLLEVKFAEVDRARLDQLGMNILSTGATNTIGTVSTQQFGPPSLGGAGGGVNTGTLSVSDILNIFLFRPDINLGVTIKALQQRALLEILAEPNLLALNGQKASFLAGGEFPFPVVQAAGNVGAITIQFRPFGVRLDFIGTIDNDVIRLHVAPEVSTLDFANSLTISGFVIPAVSTRRAETEIQLKDGQSFGIAGLLDQRAQAQLAKIPGIANIPILGRLFSSKSVNRSRTELIVLVTPHVVDPVRAGAAAPQEPRPPMPYLDSPSFDKTIPGNKNSQTPRPPE